MHGPACGGHPGGGKEAAQGMHGPACGGHPGGGREAALQGKHDIHLILPLGVLPWDVLPDTALGCTALGCRDQYCRVGRGVTNPNHLNKP